MEIFVELSVIIVIAMFVSLLMRALKQPLIVGYIFTGILVGPYFLNLIQNGDVIELFSKIGITILLFIVGLNLSPNVIREVGKVSLLTGIGQVLFTSIIGFFIATALGIDRIAAIYVAIALTFSSTIIILKLLSDKGDLNKLYGKIAIGFLLVQDIVATLILLFTSSFAGGEGSVLFIALMTVIKGSLLILTMVAISHYILPQISTFIAASQELLFLFSLSWGLGIAALFSLLGFSVEIGALVAGVALSMTPYAIEVASRMRPLRDFFILLFFILLGSHMVFENIFALIIPAILLSLFVLIGNPIIVVILMNVLGYSKRTGYQAGLTVAQISEFSLILATLGFEFGHISREILSLITFVGLITIAGSTYLILYSDEIYPYVEKFLSFLEIYKNGNKRNKNKGYNSILFGYQRVGQDFIEAFNRLDLAYIVVDFNPESIKKLEEEEIPFKYGDAKDPEFLTELDFKNLRYMVSTIPEFETNLVLVRRIRAKNKRAIMIVISHDREEALALYAEGASYVIMPHYLGAQYAVRLIGRAGLDRREYDMHREKHLAHLEKRIA
ncbi:sodium:proton exchanger [Candidatus Roizmanbacteria bacterium CG_4_9_14_0_2_um_filter_39_13]|uniref:Sodium:proton exchanger n=1 Tax=Candidatus Roizmanbacteria bacterium CG_4_9_14_0_2_um_filter_39_13 TaxID=1974839 RepID=A0A2M8EYN6_9BACT|nr:MAG: sodium:proton exchanger [Candidatus Roizmanbacteria bacterium CG_4_10_14_0_2_um_filter_39_12]PJC31701.1 MAG: sodium:proton exchanger [Candidatus Roizmanbacteria bacterium CG_4_9_14_0_2_um_filter_39_13]